MNDELLKKYFIEKNLKSNSVNGYLSALRKYESFHNLSIDELIAEAKKEEKAKIKLKNRTVKQRLISFRQYLIMSPLSSNTSQTYFIKVKSFYRFNDIELPELPKVKYPADYESNYSDLPSKKHIKRAIEISSPLMKAVILFMISSGAGKSETLSLTVDQFIEGTKEYHHGGTIEEILDELGCKNNIVPTLYMKRIKTDKYYFTFCSPEATSYIIHYLKTRENLNLKDSLFNISDTALSVKFREINDLNNWGVKGKYRYFRPHALRKFHASNIGMPAEYVDELQGRGKSEVHEAYVKTNPEELKKLYSLKMSNLKIMNDKKEESQVKEEYNITINIFLSGKDFIIQ